jgi:hypothetical protein
LSKKINIQSASKWIGLIFMIIMIVLIVFGLSDYTNRSGSLTTETIEHTIEKYAISCYATEGSYPPDIEYLTQHYGLILDEENYVYDYEAFASNLLPVISVIEKQ